MALLDFHHELFGRVGVYAATVGAADLPSTGGAFGIGDLVINLNAVAGTPAMWACTVASPSPAFVSIASFGGTNSGGAAFRSLTAGVQIVATAADRYIEAITSATGGLLLPSAVSFPIGKPITLNNSTGSSITITATAGTVTPSTLANNLSQTWISDGANWISAH